jgi:iron(III) transport system ATP-binding protein
MNEGKIIQQDTAKALFYQPKAKMVAEFLGQGIYIDAQYQGELSFKTPLGAVTSTQDVNADNDQGVLYIRPQYISLKSKCTSKTDHSVTILSKRFMGTRYIYRINILEQEIEIASTDDGEFNHGDQVNLNILPHPVNFFIN